MIVKETLNGFAAFEEFVSQFASGGKLILLFTGAPTATAASWCSDCIAADPVIETVLEENKQKDLTFAKVIVGARDEWKDPKCPFRTDPRLKLTSVPTLLLWKSVEKLNDADCQDADNVRMLFESI